MKQEDGLKGLAATLDTATKENLNDLVKIGLELLNKPVSRVDPETGLLKPIPGMGTNADILKRFYTNPALLFFSLSNTQALFS